jgi:hypothetical protein
MGILIALLALQYGHGGFGSPGPGFMAFWSGVTTSVFAVVGLAVSWKKKAERKNKPLWGPLWYKSLVVLLSMVGFGLFLNFLGFLICTFLFMSILLRLIEPHNGTMILGVALGTVIPSYLISDWLL